MSVWDADPISVGRPKGEAVSESGEPGAPSLAGEQLAEELVERAKSDGVGLVGPGGLLSGLTWNLLEVSLEAKMSEHVPAFGMLVK